MNFMSNETFNLAMIILSVGSVVSPMFYGCIFLFMFKWFPTRREVELQEQNQIIRHRENQGRFETIEGDIKKLLER